LDTVEKGKGYVDSGGKYMLLVNRNENSGEKKMQKNANILAVEALSRRMTSLLFWC